MKLALQFCERIELYCARLKASSRGHRYPYTSKYGITVLYIFGTKGKMHTNGGAIEKQNPAVGNRLRTLCMIRFSREGTSSCGMSQQSPKGAASDYRAEF